MKSSGVLKESIVGLLVFRNVPPKASLSSVFQRLAVRRTKTLVPISNKFLEPKIIKPERVTNDLDTRKLGKKKSSIKNASHTKWERMLDFKQKVAGFYTICIKVMYHNQAQGTVLPTRNRNPGGFLLF